MRYILSLFIFIFSYYLHPITSFTVPSGVQSNYPDSKLTGGLLNTSGFACSICYMAPFNKTVILSTIKNAPCYSNPYVFFGAKQRPGSTSMIIGAFASSSFITTLPSTTINTLHYHNGLYWYAMNLLSIGFTPANTVSQTNTWGDSADISLTSWDRTLRMSWVIDGVNGAGRAGPYLLSQSATGNFQRVIYTCYNAPTGQPTSSPSIHPTSIPTNAPASSPPTGSGFMGDILGIKWLSNTSISTIDVSQYIGSGYYSMVYSTFNTFVSGVSGTALIANRDDLQGWDTSSVTIISRTYNCLVSELFSHAVYCLADAQMVCLTGPGTVVHLVPISQNSGHPLSSGIITLKKHNITLTSGSASFSGESRIVLVDGTTGAAWNINTANGFVLPIGYAAVRWRLPTTSGAWLAEGVAGFGNLPQVAIYYGISSGKIEGQMVSDTGNGQIGILFDPKTAGLGDLACFTLDIISQQWYFIYKGNGIFGNTGITLGTAETNLWYFLPTGQPTSTPSTSHPTGQPTSNPTSPTSTPTSQPSPKPTPIPTARPSFIPTFIPTAYPTVDPTPYPTPNPSAEPTARPSTDPTVIPTPQPSTEPTARPSTDPTVIPTPQPSAEPTTRPSSIPTVIPTPQPSAEPTVRPSSIPTVIPTPQPSAEPTVRPSSIPTTSPTDAPTFQPTTLPTPKPSAEPTVRPSSIPSSEPTSLPTISPTPSPTPAPTKLPTFSPTSRPTSIPTPSPSRTPTTNPTTIPTFFPTFYPTTIPTPEPTTTPSTEPTFSPSTIPTFNPTAKPTRLPTPSPSTPPTFRPTATPSTKPTPAPSTLPTRAPISGPSPKPTPSPTFRPTVIPSFMPSTRPTVKPTFVPTAMPSFSPTGQPTSSPSYGQSPFDFADLSNFTLSSTYIKDTPYGVGISGDEIIITTSTGLYSLPLSFSPYVTPTQILSSNFPTLVTNLITRETLCLSQVLYTCQQGPGIVNYLLQVSPTGTIGDTYISLIGNNITLGLNSGAFSGYNRIVLVDADTKIVWNINLVTLEISFLGTAEPRWSAVGSWLFLGVAGYLNFEEVELFYPSFTGYMERQFVGDTLATTQVDLYYAGLGTIVAFTMDISNTLWYYITYDSTNNIFSLGYSGLKYMKNVPTGQPSGQPSGFFPKFINETIKSMSTYRPYNMYAFAALKFDGSVVTWGDSMFGGDSSYVSSELSSDVIDVIPNSNSFAAMKSDGSVVFWGTQFHTCSTTFSSVPFAGQEIIQIVPNEFSFAAIRADGSVVAFGDSFHGGYLSPQDRLMLTNVKTITATANSFTALTSSGLVYTWGDPNAGGGVHFVDRGIQNIFSTRAAFAAMSHDHRNVITWGDEGSGGNSTHVRHTLYSEIVEFIYSSHCAFAATTLSNATNVVTWGDPGCGGNSSSVASFLVGVIDIASTSLAFAALTDSGMVVTWGNPSFGGDSSYYCNYLGCSTQYGTLMSDVVSIVGNGGAFAAHTSTGNVFTWGHSRFGGDSWSVQDRLSNVVKIFKTRSAFAALKSDRTVVTWGSSMHGGDSSSVNDLLIGVSTICSNEGAFAAILSDGSVVTWGSVNSGGNSTAIRNQLTGVKKCSSIDPYDYYLFPTFPPTPTPSQIPSTPAPSSFHSSRPSSAHPTKKPFTAPTFSPTTI